MFGNSDDPAEITNEVQTVFSLRQEEKNKGFYPHDNGDGNAKLHDNKPFTF